MIDFQMVLTQYHHYNILGLIIYMTKCITDFFKQIYDASTKKYVLSNSPPCADATIGQ